MNTSDLPTNSLFIPRIDYSITKPQLKTFFEDNFDCHVCRIDFVAFQNHTGVGRRAFIHFLHFYDSDFIQALDANKMLLLQCNGFDLSVLINKNPIPETTLNTAQLAANNEFLSEEVKRQAQEIEYLKEVQNEFYFRFEEMRQQMEHLQAHVQRPYLLYPPNLYPPPPPTTPTKEPSREYLDLDYINRDKLDEQLKKLNEMINENQSIEEDSFYDEYDIDSVC
jgi:hypothetical protein